MVEKSAKTARLEARITPEVYALLQSAAALQGRSVSDFVIHAAQQAAEEAIERRAIVELTQADQLRFAEALMNPSPIAPALKRAAANRRRLTGAG